MDLDRLRRAIRPVHPRPADAMAGSDARLKNRRQDPGSRSHFPAGESVGRSAPGQVPRISGGRIGELDSLRGLAALAVMIFHANPGWLPFGWAAVDLFFVLSGYLITSIIVRDGTSPGFLRAFYVRRGLRTWPIYYLTIAVIIVLSPLLSAPCHWAGLPRLLTYTQGFPLPWAGTTPRFSTYLIHTWTLAIEEQFYLIWPALALLAGRRRLGLLAIACAAGSALARGGGLSFDTLAGRADGLALGGLLATIRIAHDKPGPRIGALRLKFGLVALAALGVAIACLRVDPIAGLARRPGVTVLAVNLLWFGTIGLVLTLSGHPALSPLRSRTLRYLGRISYGLYLYHVPVVLISFEVAHTLGLSGRLYWLRVMALIASFVVASLSWRFIERPLLDLKDRVAYRPRPEAIGS